MKQAWKRILSFAFVLILVLSLAAPAFAASTIEPRTGAVTVVLPKKSKNNYTVGIRIASSESDFVMNRSDVKVSKGSCNAKLVGFDKISSLGETINSSYREYDKGWAEDRIYSYDDYSYEVWVRVTKPGTAKLTYNLNGSTYTINLKALKYSNPVKSLTIKGYKGGANLASKTASQSYVTLKQGAAIKDAELTVKAKSGWKVRSLSITDFKTNAMQNVQYGSNAKGVTSLTIDYGNMPKGHYYSINASFVNTKTGAVSTVTYFLN